MSHDATVLLCECLVGVTMKLSTMIVLLMMVMMTLIRRKRLIMVLMPLHFWFMSTCVMVMLNSQNCCCSVWNLQNSSAIVLKAYLTILMRGRSRSLRLTSLCFHT